MQSQHLRTARRERIRATLLVLSLILATVTVVGAARSLTRTGTDRDASPNIAVDAPPVGPNVTTPVTPTSPMVWSDEFSLPAGASPHGPTWRFVTGGDGWGNGELECYTDARDNSAIDGQGDLVITARYSPSHRCADGSVDDYTSARISTEGLRTLEYGHVRVRAELPTASGVWPAIWALGVNSPQVGYPKSGEIDIAEVIGQTPTKIYGTVHGPVGTDSIYAISGKNTLAAPASAAFHVYGLDWTPASLSISVDGHVYSRVSRAYVQRYGEWVFDRPFYLLLDVAVGGDFPGPPDDPSAYPQSMRVDYVRVYS